MSEAKQVIVMRKDLNMRKGKMCAQAAHASMAFLTRNLFRERTREYPGIGYFHISLSEAATAWIEGRFTKICVSVDSERELLDIHTNALEAGLNSQLIVDAGLTEFGGVPTRTCLAIGPDWSDKIDEVTGHLPLL